MLKRGSSKKGKAIDLIALAQKIEFCDFLKIMSKDKIINEILSEHKMNYLTIKHQFFRQQKKLYSELALEAMKINADREITKNQAMQSMEDVAIYGEQPKEVKVPTLTYVIEEFVMFKMDKQYKLLIKYENNSVSLYDYNSGHFEQGFVFQDNVLT